MFFSDCHGLTALSEGGFQGDSPRFEQIQKKKKNSWETKRIGLGVGRGAADSSPKKGSNVYSNMFFFYFMTFAKAGCSFSLDNPFRTI